MLRGMDRVEHYRTSHRAGKNTDSECQPSPWFSIIPMHSNAKLQRQVVVGRKGEGMGKRDSYM